MTAGAIMGEKERSAAAALQKHWDEADPWRAGRGYAMTAGAIKG